MVRIAPNTLTGSRLGVLSSFLRSPLPRLTWTCRSSCKLAVSYSSCICDEHQQESGPDIGDNRRLSPEPGFLAWSIICCPLPHNKLDEIACLDQARRSQCPSWSHNERGVPRDPWTAKITTNPHVLLQAGNREDFWKIFSWKRKRKRKSLFLFVRKRDAKKE